MTCAIAQTLDSEGSAIEAPSSSWHRSSVACLAHSAYLWKARSPEDLTVDSVRLFTVVHPRPEIVIVGLGAKGPRNRLSDIEAFLKHEGIALEQMDTPNAVHTFNILNDEKRNVGALLLTLEPRGRDEYADPFDAALEHLES